MWCSCVHVARKTVRETSFRRNGIFVVVATRWSDISVHLSKVSMPNSLKRQFERRMIILCLFYVCLQNIRMAFMTTDICAGLVAEITVLNM